MIVLNILKAFLVVGIFGGLLGYLLSLAAKLFAVEKDEKVEAVEKALPGLNCGACGYAGCSGYADAVINTDARLTLCTPGGPEVAKKIGEILGKEVETSKTRKVAQIHCRGGKETSDYTYNYDGIDDCNAMHILYRGNKTCKYGCLGLGSCIKVCPVDAIYYDDNDLIWIDSDRCISCGKCIDICPVKVIKWVPYGVDVIVACNSKDPGKVVRKICKVGCIACKLCEKKSPEGGYTVENNLSTIDYSIKGSRIDGMKACPPKCIIPAEKGIDPAQKKNNTVMVANGEENDKQNEPLKQKADQKESIKEETEISKKGEQ